MGANYCLGSSLMLALGDVAFPPNSSVCSMGFLLDQALLLDVQVATVAMGAFFHLQRVPQLWPFQDRRNLVSMTHARLVTSRFDYCNAVCVGMCLKTVQKLQLILNAASHVTE